jgi:hypothetical protein
VQPLEHQPLERCAGRERLDADQGRHVAPSLVAHLEAGPAHLGLRKDGDLQRGELRLAVEPLVQGRDRQVTDMGRQAREERRERGEQDGEQHRQREPGAARHATALRTGRETFLHRCRTMRNSGQLSEPYGTIPVQPVSSRIASSVERST